MDDCLIKHSGSDILRTGLVTIVMENEICGLQSNGLLSQEIADLSVSHFGIMCFNTI